MLLLCCCSLSYGNKERQEFTNQLNHLIIGKWTNKRIQVQYIVDSHLVHEEEITSEKGTVYTFDKTSFQIKYPGGTTAQGTYTVMLEDDKRKIVLNLPNATTIYSLVAITPSSMVWQKDLENTYYNEGSNRKSAERAIYTEEFIK